MSQESQSTDDLQARATHGSTEQAKSDEAQAFEEILAQTMKEAEEHALKEEEEQLNKTLEMSKNDIPKGDFACEEDEEAYVTRLTQQTMRDYLDEQKARGAVADDDCRVIEEVTHRSMKDYHKMAWDNEPVPDGVWVEREKIDQDDRVNDQKMWMQQRSYAQQQYYSMQQSFQSMSFYRSGFGAGIVPTLGQGGPGPRYGGYPPHSGCAVSPSSQLPSSSSSSFPKSTPSTSSNLGPSAPRSSPPVSIACASPSQTSPPTSQEAFAHDALPMTPQSFPTSVVAININENCPSTQEGSVPSLGDGLEADQHSQGIAAGANIEGGKEQDNDEMEETSENKNFIKSKHVDFLDRFEKKI
jgi:hypothetical protein